MKIGILTWHKALNHGAVLQAYATQNFLKSNGYDSIILDYKRKVVNQQSRLLINWQRMKKLFNGALKDRKYVEEMDARKRALFNDFITENLKCGELYSKEHLDCTIVGSDMVFSLIQGYNEYMFGIGVNTDRIFSYAASAGGTKLSLVEKMNVKEQIKNSLEKFSSVGYRDLETKQLLENIGIQQNMHETIDPVLLYGFETEKNTWDTMKWERHKPYLLVYAYHGFLNDKKECKQIEKYAQENNLKIVSCGYYHSWCNENINAGPKEFLEMFKHAQYVVTDTFHGAVFSIICRKKFVSIVRNNGFKLRYLLQCCQLNDRIADNSEKIYSILCNDIDYQECYQWLKEKKKDSSQFLLDNIMEK